MTATVIRQYTALAFAHVRNLLRHACERKPRIARSVVADHHRPILIFGRRVVYSDIEIRVWHRHLHCLLEKA